MKLQEFVARTRLPVSAEAAYAWHARPGAFARLSPPWQRVDVIEQGVGLAEGTRVVLELRAGPLRKRWTAVHGPCLEGREFRDRSTSGPFAHWEHVHRFEADGADACRLEDRVSFALPFSAASQPLLGRWVRGRLEALFRYRHDTTRGDLLAHAAAAASGARPLRVLVSGASGLLGRQLVAFLSTGGHEVVRLLRTGMTDVASLEGFDAVVHLAGEGIAARRWSAAHKAAIRDSRVALTADLARSLAGCRRRPSVFACASAIGFYGLRGDEILTERSAAGDGFLAEVCQDWEAATAPARDAGIRTVNLRFGVVLTPQGGALAKLLPPFRCGVGGPVGNGRQWWSWVSIDDVLGAVHHALLTDTLAGPCNVVAPQPAQNAAFARTLGAVLGRPAVLPLPAPAARLLVGEMAEALLLGSTRAVPLALLNSGYAFRHPSLEPALRHLLGRAAT